MIIVELIGGLGNQMFQYAYYTQLKYLGYNVKSTVHRYDKYKLHNGFELSNIFQNIDIEFATKEEDSIYYNKFNKFLQKLKLGNKIIHQDVFCFHEKYFKLPNNCYIAGYWSSNKYFINVQNIIKNHFLFPEFNIIKNINLYQQIISSNSVSIHVRRGDYVGHKLYENICTVKYYKMAIEYIKNKINNPLFFVFSNDIKWCKDNFNFIDAIFIDHNHKTNSYRDMQMISNCKHNILANSSFSWWGAFLNQNKNPIIITPKKFFNGNIYDERDMYPNTWIKI
jgi:hypothetical protein